MRPTLQVESTNVDENTICKVKKNDLSYVDNFLTIVIEREKAKPGCNFELYYKLKKKCRKILFGYSDLKFQDINYDKCVTIAKIFAQHKGYKHTSKSFRNLLGKASKDADVNFSVSQIGEFVFSQYDPHINEVDIKQPDVLSSEQLKKFINLDLSKVTVGFKSEEMVELYHDFCVFMFHSFFAPCDAIKLKYKDITKNGTIVIKRKKTHKILEVPMNPVMKNIIDKYRGKTKNGYVFPVLDDSTVNNFKTKEYALKKFREHINIWLKPVGRILNTEFDLYAYVFRHTAITIALDNNVPNLLCSKCCRHKYQDDTGTLL